MTPTPNKKTFESEEHSSTEEEIVKEDKDEEFEDFNSQIEVFLGKFYA